ncbi:hypothetical protein N9Y55_00700 [bacterium]|nr:hypothetical protein [bacterium]
MMRFSTVPMQLNLKKFRQQSYGASQMARPEDYHLPLHPLLLRSFLGRSFRFTSMPGNRKSLFVRRLFCDVNFGSVDQQIFRVRAFSNRSGNSEITQFLDSIKSFQTALDDLSIIINELNGSNRTFDYFR